MKKSYFKTMSEIKFAETQKDHLICKLKSEYAETKKEEMSVAVSVVSGLGTAVASAGDSTQITGKQKTHSRKHIAIIIAIIMLCVIITPIAIFFGVTGNGQISQIGKAFSDAKFAPEIEDVVPGFAIEQNASSAPVNSAATGISADVTLASTNYAFAGENVVLVSDTGGAPEKNVTINSDIAASILLIENTEQLKRTVIDSVKKINEIGQWQNEMYRLDVPEDGSIEFRYRQNSIYEIGYLVRLSADRTTIEICYFPRLVTGIYTYEYSEYLRYDGEVFTHIDRLDLFQDKDPTKNIASSCFNYREYRKENNGAIKNSMVQVAKNFEFDANNMLIDDGYFSMIEATVYGGNDTSFYRYWRRMEETGIVCDFHIENSKSSITIQDHSSNYSIMASANLFNIEKIFYSNNIRYQNYDYNLYELTGIVLSNERYITVPVLDTYYLSGTLSHNLKEDVYWALLKIGGISSDTSINDAVALCGLEFIDAGLDFSDILNGTTFAILDNIRVSQIDEIKNIEISFANSTIIYEKIKEYFDAKFA